MSPPLSTGPTSSISRQLPLCKRGRAQSRRRNSHSMPLYSRCFLGVSRSKTNTTLTATSYALLRTLVGITGGVNGMWEAACRKNEGSISFDILTLSRPASSTAYLLFLGVLRLRAGTRDEVHRGKTSLGYRGHPPGIPSGDLGRLAGAHPSFQCEALMFGHAGVYAQGRTIMEPGYVKL